MPKTLMPFQRKDMYRIHGVYDGRAVVSWSMGLGKSVLAAKYIDNFVNGPAVIVCPAGLKENWKREIDEAIGRRATILGSMTPHGALSKNKRSIYVINYDVMRVSNSKKNTWTEVLRKIDPAIIAFDEAHMLKSRTAKRSKACKELAADVPEILALSGTPILSRPIELWHTLSIVKPDLFPDERAYGCRYCAGYRHPRWGWDFSGASNTRELHQILTGDDGCMVRRLKTDVLAELPAKRRSVVPFELPPAAMKDYREAVSNFIQWLAKKDKGKAARAAMAEALTQLMYLKRLAATHKIPQVIQWVENFLQSDEKLVLFGHHKAVLGPIFDRFRSCAVLVDGSVAAGPIRQAAYDRFNTDPRCRLLIGNMDAAGVGWSCRGTSSYAFCELPWNPGLLEQAEDRGYGIARGIEGRALNSYMLIAENTIEYKLCEVLESKSGVLGSVLDGKDNPDLNLFEILVKYLVASNKEAPKRRAR